jgi:hypothetical protein
MGHAQGTCSLESAGLKTVRTSEDCPTHPCRAGWSAAVWKPKEKHAIVAVKKSPYLDRMGEPGKKENSWLS